MSLISKSLLISEVFPPQVGGSGKWLYEIYNRLPTSQVVAVVGEHALGESIDKAITFPLYRLSLRMSSWGVCDRGSIRNYWRLHCHIARIVRQHSVTDIHAARVLPEGWLALTLKLRFGVKYRIFVHGEELQYGEASRQLRWMMNRVFKGASGIIANSANTAKVLRERWSVPQQLIQILHPGVDCSYFTIVSSRRPLEYENRLVLLTVGRLQKRKGHDTVLRAVARLKDRFPQLLYTIVGDGEERGRLEALTHDLGIADYVKFAGELDSTELLRHFQQCDLFVLANREVDGDFEGFGIVLLEAQACGKPVIAGTSGGCREAFHDQQTGLLVDCSTTDSLLPALTLLLEDEQLRLAMAKRAREWTVKHFDWNSLAAKARIALNMADSVSYS